MSPTPSPPCAYTSYPHSPVPCRDVHAVNAQHHIRLHDTVRLEAPLVGTFTPAGRNENGQWYQRSSTGGRRGCLRHVSWGGIMLHIGPATRANRWTQLWLGVVCMVMIANLQYAWTLFVEPMHQARGWSLGEIQFAFSIFVALETWITPLSGWIVDRLRPHIGPPLMIASGGVLVAVAWVINSYAESIEMLYAGAAISGLGAGAIYATCVGNAVKWFPDRRGLAVGLTAGGFGAGAALTVIPIRLVIESHGYATAFFWFGLFQGIVLLIAAHTLRGPGPGIHLPTVRNDAVPQTTRSYTSMEVLRSPAFWLLYVMFILVSASGLMATAQVAP